MEQHTGRAGRTTLFSNNVAIPFDEQYFTPMRESRLDDPARLRRSFAEDGYVLLRAVLDPGLVLDLRENYFARFEPALLAAGTTARDGIFSGTVPAQQVDYGTMGHPAYDLVRDADFDRFTRAPQLHAIAEIVLDGRAELLPRRIVRHFHRQSARASRAHVDFDYMDRGSDKLVTAWIPLGDCLVESGGLVYLERSHELSRSELDRLRSFTDRPDDPRPISNDLARTARSLGRRWLWTDYRAGDVVLHSPHTVHASLDNDTDTMRLSADIRFRKIGTAADERWNGDWSADDGF